jgi:hypothetical protein
MLHFYFAITSECVRAWTESAMRFCTPTFRSSLATWAFTVRSPIPRGDPISLLERPATSNSRTSFLAVGKGSAVDGKNMSRSGICAFNEHGKHMTGCPYRTLAHDSDSSHKFGRRGSLIDVALGSGDDSLENRLFIS